jgi:hypothetical protein
MNIAQAMASMEVVILQVYEIREGSSKRKLHGSTWPTRLYPDREGMTIFAPPAPIPQHWKRTSTAPSVYIEMAVFTD